jgi:hypothetical protein
MIKKETWYEVKETSRTYMWRDNQSLTIYNVDRLLVSKSGRHYLHTTTGYQYIIAQGWLYFSFAADEFAIPLDKEVSK